MRLTSFETFKKLARPGSRFPIVGEMINDLDTPVALYRNFSKEKYSFLLESVEGGEKWGRYSFIGISPSTVFRSEGNRVTLLEGMKRSTREVEDPLGELKSILNRYRFVPSPDLPRFTGGAVGSVSYDMVRFFEKIPDRGRPDSGVPDLYFVVPQILLMVDNLEQTLKIIYDARINKADNAASVKKEYEKGCRLIRKVARQLERRVKTPALLKSPPIRWKANLTEQGYRGMVEKTRDYIFAGDITQAVLSIRFEAKSKIAPFSLYRAIRRVNPSPYMFLLKFDEMNLVGASPETMVRLEEGEMTLRPIAGTRHRGKDDEEDRALEKELLADEKERAEHIMLVDLGRNDLGRVAASGTVKVDELMTIERYSHVMHIVSNVRAKLASGKDAFDLLRATFPAGTLSGSPKIRAMEIIEELEPVRRGFYGGCIGYFSFSGNMDMAITIRSALLQRGKIFVQAGAGIVADSKPELEYKECLNKAKAVMKAVELCS
jgi:anthranilate synthase component 1